MRYTWDDEKNIININKHGINFEEAKTVFNDIFAVVIYDKKHSENEERFHIIGLSDKANLLLVCHCYKDNDTIHLISAWRATKEETQIYLGG